MQIPWPKITKLLEHVYGKLRILVCMSDSHTAQY